MGDVREEQLRLSLRVAARVAVHAQLEPGIPRLRVGTRLPAEERRDPARALFGHAPVLPVGSPRQDARTAAAGAPARSEEHTSELQSRENLVCRLLLEKK